MRNQLIKSRDVRISSPRTPFSRDLTIPHSDLAHLTLWIIVGSSQFWLKKQMKKAIVFYINFPDTIFQKATGQCVMGRYLSVTMLKQCNKIATDMERSYQLFIFRFVRWYWILPTLEIRSTYFVDMNWKICPHSAVGSENLKPRLHALRLLLGVYLPKRVNICPSLLNTLVGKRLRLYVF